MKKCCKTNGVILFIVGALIGAGVTYHYAKCETKAMSIHLQSNAKDGGPGITITHTGDAKK